MKKGRRRAERARGGKKEKKEGWQTPEKKTGRINNMEKKKEEVAPGHV
jgi:hypothetical protein